MRISVRRAGAVAGLLALAAVTAFGGRRHGRPGSKAKSPSKAMAEAAHGASGGGGGLKVVAEGLDNPRGIGFGPDGALYVAESGRGWRRPCVQGPEGEEACFGRSGAVTRIAKRSRRRVLTGLPSVAEEGGIVATGPVERRLLRLDRLPAGRQHVGGTETREQFGPAAGASASCSRSTCAGSAPSPTSRPSRLPTTPTRAPAPSPAASWD